MQVFREEAAHGETPPSSGKPKKGRKKPGESGEQDPEHSAPDALQKARAVQREVLDELTTCTKLRTQLVQYELSADLAQYFKETRKQLNTEYSKLTLLIDQGLEKEEDYAEVMANIAPIRQRCALSEHKFSTIAAKMITKTAFQKENALGELIS